MRCACPGGNTGAVRPGSRAGMWKPTLLCSALLAAGMATGWAAGLPPAPAAGSPSAGITLYLELVVNEQSSGDVVPVQVRDGHYYVAAEILRPLHVQLAAGVDGLVAVDQIAGVTVKYDSIAQKLQLMLPAEWLPAQQLGSASVLATGKPIGGFGFLLNYDLYASNIGLDGAAASLWTEQRVFGSLGLLSNTGVYRQVFATGHSDYVRYDTRWSYSDTETVRTYTAGDLITGSLPWGNAVRIGGFQIARNFGVRPDLIPYPLPRFSGSAAVPSAVDLFINGYKAGSEAVQPGPFTLNTMPFINGAGEASVVTTDALGRRVLTTVPFYVANTLLKVGTTDYSLAGGLLRRNYGTQNFSYGRPSATGSYRRGITDTLTLEARGEAARGVALAGAGAVANVGGLGVVSGSVSESRSDASNGRQWTVGYQYNGQRFGVGVQHTRRSVGYRDLGNIESETVRNNPRSTQATASGSLGEAGSVSAGYFDVLAYDGQRTRLATATYTKPLGTHSFLSLNLSKAIGKPDYNVLLQWTLLFDERGSVTTSVTRNREATTQQVQYSRSPPPAGGLGWNLAYGNNPGPNDFKQASATWRGDTTQLQGGVFSQGNTTSNWAGAAGSVVVMDGGVFAANRINDAFALVSTAGVGDVPVRFENQIIGRTNANGHLLVPGVNAYYPARFEIDTLELPDYMQAPQGEQRVLLRSGSGALLRFPIEKVQAASLTLVDESGQPLPVGLLAQHLQSGRSGVVGWDGQLYLEGLKRENEVLVKGPAFTTCRVRFELDVTSPRVARLGPLTCRPLPSSASALRWQ